MIYNAVCERLKGVYFFEKQCNRICTGGGSLAAVSILERRGVSIKAIIDRDPKQSSWQGHVLMPEDFLVSHPEYLEGSSFVIASQYNDLIYNRLTSKGIELTSCYVLNELGKTPYHNEKVIPYTDNRFKQVEELWADSYSRELFRCIIQSRKETGDDFLPYGEAAFSCGLEDYWMRVKPIRKHQHAVVVDAGAYVGDSIEAICTAVGPEISRYYAFEPNLDSFQILVKKRSSSLCGELICINKGLGSANMDLYFQNNTESPDASHFSDEQKDNSTKVSLWTLDSLDLETDADIFIKMDIEGSEMDALRGGTGLIQERKPSLAVCVYHKENDLVEIPLFLKSLVPEYKLFLCGGSHTICIAQVDGEL